MAVLATAQPSHLPRSGQKIQKLPRNITHSVLTTTLYGDLPGSTVVGLHCWQIISHHNLWPQPQRYVNLLASQNTESTWPGLVGPPRKGIGLPEQPRASSSSAFLSWLIAVPELRR